MLLALESSCDECSASVVSGPSADGSLTVKSVCTYSQVDLHKPFGGVVPEVASRNHLETINHMVEAAIKEAGVSMGDLEAIAVTNRPGLVGALMVGVTAGKTLAYVHDLPLVPVHHLEGHACSIFLDQDIAPEYPMLLAIVSGGHTNLHVVREQPSQWGPNFLRDSLVGRSRDDAAGEAFDKTAKLMGFPYPGGVHLDRAAQGGDATKYDLPRALPQKAVLDFSFSGLKTAVALKIREIGDALEEEIPHLAASTQEAIVDALMKKVLLALEKYNCKSMALVGGVAANSRLRARLGSELGVPLYLPHSKYCTDNAAMIGAAGAYRFSQGAFVQGQELLTLGAKAHPES